MGIKKMDMVELIDKSDAHDFLGDSWAGAAWPVYLDDDHLFIVIREGVQPDGEPIPSSPMQWEYVPMDYKVYNATTSTVVESGEFLPAHHPHLANYFNGVAHSYSVPLGDGYSIYRWSAADRSGGSWIQRTGLRMVHWDGSTLTMGDTYKFDFPSWWNSILPLSENRFILNSFGGSFIVAERDGLELSFGPTIDIRDTYDNFRLRSASLVLTEDKMVFVGNDSSVVNEGGDWSWFFFLVSVSENGDITVERGPKIYDVNEHVVQEEWDWIAWEPQSWGFFPRKDDGAAALFAVDKLVYELDEDTWDEHYDYHLSCYYVDLKDSELQLSNFESVLLEAEDIGFTSPEFLFGSGSWGGSFISAWGQPFFRSPKVSFDSRYITFVEQVWGYPFYYDEEWGEMLGTSSLFVHQIYGITWDVSRDSPSLASVDFLLDSTGYNDWFVYDYPDRYVRTAPKIRGRTDYPLHSWIAFDNTENDDEGFELPQYHTVGSLILKPPFWWSSGTDYEDNTYFLSFFGEYPLAKADEPPEVFRPWGKFTFRENPYDEMNVPIGDTPGKLFAAPRGLYWAMEKSSRDRYGHDSLYLLEYETGEIKDSWQLPREAALLEYPSHKIEVRFGVLYYAYDGLKPTEKIREIYAYDLNRREDIGKVFSLPEDQPNAYMQDWSVRHQDKRVFTLLHNFSGDQ